MYHCLASEHRELLKRLLISRGRMSNVDHNEISKFEALASRWWDTESEFKPLHDINPLRTNYIDSQVHLAGKKVLDVGCGGGLLSETMALRGADVTGIDLGERSEERRVGKDGGSGLITSDAVHEERARRR